MATCINWLLVRPRISPSLLSASFCGYSVPSGMIRLTDPGTSRLPVFFPAPLVRSFRCLGTRRTVYSRLFSPAPSEKTSSTNGSTFNSAYWLCSTTPSFLFVLDCRIYYIYYSFYYNFSIRSIF